MSARHSVSLLLASFLLVGCGEGETTAPSVAPAPTRAALTAVPGVTEVVDEIGPGSIYALFVPSGWSAEEGELVVYAHGYIQPFLEPALPTELDGLRDWLLTQGLAVAYSSYSHTGYAVKDGSQRTHQLRGQFVSEFGRPATTYVVGTSMGGVVAAYLEERFGPQYDGALLLCGALAGALSNAEYIAQVRVLWDALFPGTLEGSVVEVPDGYLVIPPDPATGYPGSTAYHAIVGAIAADPVRAAMLTAIDPVNMPIDATDPKELVPALVKVLGYQINGANALREQVSGHSFFDNSETWYSGSPDDDALNAAVTRYTSDPSAVRTMDRWYTPTGQIDDPVVALHTTRDPLVPGRVEAWYAEQAAAFGNADRFIRMAPTDNFGHCAFEGPDIIRAFLTLRGAVAAD